MQIVRKANPRDPFTSLAERMLPSKRLLVRPPTAIKGALSKIQAYQSAS
jgi:hypothetical protein